MPTYPFMQVDAFTSRPLAGNPCAILFDTDGMQEAAMLAVAREMNLSETAFVRGSQAGGFSVRFFTPAEEIPLAGHPIIASVFALGDSGRLQLSGPHTSIQLGLKEGPITVEILADGVDQGDGQLRIVMTQRRPEFLGVLEAGQVLPAFGLEPQDALEGCPLQVVSTGTRQLMVPLRDHEALRRARLDEAHYQALRAASGFFSPHLFCLGGATPAGDTFARHFGTPPDLLEDPFTGSATGGMAAYLWRYGLIGQPSFTAEQGHWLGRPGQASVEVIGPPQDIAAVKVGGYAVTVLRGEFYG
jgi:trans-2,3-dihydro-3-hydroxyanthranilate isomerase